LDMQNDQRNAQWIMGKNCARNCFRRTDDGAVHAESTSKFIAELFEEVNMFRFFSRKFQERAGSMVVLAEIRPGMIQYEWENEFLDQTENAQVRMTPDLVQLKTLGSCEKVELIRPRQGFRHEWPAEVEPLISADDVFDPPVDFLGGLECPLICVAAGIDLPDSLYRNHKNAPPCKFG